MGAAIRSCSKVDVSRPNSTWSGNQSQSSNPDAGSANAYSIATRMMSAPPLPSASPQPDTVPRRWYGTTLGSIALWKTSVNANPVPATASRHRDGDDAETLLARNGQPQEQDRGEHHDDERADPRLAAPDLVRDGPEKWCETGGDRSGEAVDVAPDLLAAHRVADHFRGEVGPEDVDDDEDVIGIARPLEDRPAELPERAGMRRPVAHAYGTPCASTYRAYRDWAPVMKSRLRLTPPKQRLDTPSGR